MSLRRRGACARGLLLGAAIAVVAAPAAPAERGWLAPEPVTSSAVMLRGSAVAVTSSGEAVVAWSERRPDNTTQLSVRSKPAGGAFGPPAVLDAGGYGPVLQAVPGGEVVAAWTRNDGSGERAVVAIRSAGGEWSPPADLGASGHFAAVTLAAGPDGDVAVALQRQGALHVAYRPAGGSFGDPVAVPGGESATRTSLAIAHGGRTLIGWSSSVPGGGNGGNEQMRAAWREGGQPPGEYTNLSPKPGNTGRGIRVAIAPDGRAIAAWVGPVGDTIAAPVRAAIGTADGGWRAAELTTADTSGSTPAVGVDRDGRAILVWNSYKSSGQGATAGPARYALGDLASARFGTAIDVDAGIHPWDPGGHPQLIVAPDGAAVLMTGGAFVNRGSLGAGFGITRVVACPTGIALLGGLALDGTATVLLERRYRDIGASELSLAQDAPTGGLQKYNCSVPYIPPPSAPIVLPPVERPPLATIELVAGQRLRALARRGVRVRITSKWPGPATIEARVDAATARRLGGRRSFARRALTVPAERAVTVRLVPSRAIVRRAAKLRRLKLTLTLAVPGNGVATRSVSLRR